MNENVSFSHDELKKIAFPLLLQLFLSLSFSQNGIRRLPHVQEVSSLSFFLRRNP